MSNVFVNETYLSDIADAIREKLDTETTYKPSQMADAIESIETGGITPTGTKSITANGTYDVTNYASADVNVPTGSTPVINSLSVTENGTYTAPTGVDGYSPITVNVSGGGGTDLSGAVLDGSISGAYENTDITYLRTHALDACASLTSVSFPNVEKAETNALYNCKNITSVNFPKLKTIGTYAFSGMLKLASVSLPSAPSSLVNYLFYGDTQLKTADIGASCSGLGGQTFGNCSVLDTVILRRTAGVVSCSTNTFNGTPFASGGSGGTVYVPNSLIASYKIASNWSTLYNAGTCTFTALEGSVYE